MRLAHRDWRTIAYYRGVGAVENRRELNQCLREQMTSRERTDWHNGVVVAVLAALAAWLFAPGTATRRWVSSSLGVCMRRRISASIRSIAPSGSTSLIWKPSYGYKTNKSDENAKV